MNLALNDVSKCKTAIRMHFVFQSQQVRNYYMFGDVLIQNVFLKWLYGLS